MVIYMIDVDTVTISDAWLTERGELPFCQRQTHTKTERFALFVSGYFILLSVRGTMNASGHRPHANPTQRSGR